MSGDIRELKEDISYEIPNKDKQGTVTNPSNGIRIQKHLGIVYVQNRGQHESYRWVGTKVVKEDFESNKA
jgi:hypothetical protein